MLQVFPSEIGNRIRMPAITTSIQHCSEGSSWYNNLGKNLSIRIEKEKTKSSFSQYTEKSKRTYK